MSTAADDVRLLGYAGNDTLTAFGNRDVLLGRAGRRHIDRSGQQRHVGRRRRLRQLSGPAQRRDDRDDNGFADGIATARGEVDFGAGIDHNGLWFERIGNDLQVDVMDTPDHVTLGGWYAGDARAQVESFNTENGMQLDTQVASLVQAMATYSQANPTFDPTANPIFPSIKTVRVVLRFSAHGPADW